MNCYKNKIGNILINKYVYTGVRTFLVKILVGLLTDFKGKQNRTLSDVYNICVRLNGVCLMPLLSGTEVPIGDQKY